MHIVASEQMSFNASQQSLFGREVRESLQFNNGQQSINYQRHEQEVFASAGQMQAKVDSGPQISQQALQRYADSLPSRPDETEELPDFTPDEEDLEKLRVLLAALARLNGELENFKIVYPLPELELQMPTQAVAQTQVQNQADGQIPAGLRYDYHVQQWQQQQLNVAASGKLTTADGRVLDFNLQLDMQHTQYSSQSVSFSAGQLKDPLVVNYAGQPVQLTGKSMNFDLDADGKQDRIAMLANGSAYLALDKNSNGKIDNGHELFGAISGDGFAELAAYDIDGNGFIDSADPVFKDLRLWIPDEQGGGQLLGLKEAGIGALGLMRAAGGFDLYVADELKGQVRSTGIFVFADGQVGSMQQIDLVV